MHALAKDYDQKLTWQADPGIRRMGEGEKRRDLSVMTSDQLIELWHAREKRVMDEFAPHSLLPSLISRRGAGGAQGVLEESFWDEDPEQLATCSRPAHAADQTVQSQHRACTKSPRRHWELSTRGSPLAMARRLRPPRPRRIRPRHPPLARTPGGLLTLRRGSRTEKTPPTSTTPHIDKCRATPGPLDPALAPISSRLDESSPSPAATCRSARTASTT